MFRRWSAALWVAMVAHGVWDISAFLSGQYGGGVFDGIATAMSMVVALTCLVAVIRSLRQDNRYTVTPQGIEQLAPT